MFIRIHMGLQIILGMISQVMAAGFIDHVNGVPYTWQQNEIVYRVDPGPLSSGINNADAKAIIAQAFAVWHNVSVSNGLVFTQGTDLSADVSGTNFSSYIQVSDDGFIINPTNDTVIIFDYDGQILYSLLGSQSSRVLGMASPGKYDESSHKIVNGYAIINGSVADLTATKVQATMTHEFGHLLNISHTQLNIEEALNSDPNDDGVIPTMFPILPVNSAVFHDLALDDELAMGYLYPHPTNFAARGRIFGKVLRGTGEGVRGVFVICRNVNNPRAEAVSWISDQIIQSKGEYLCGNLSTGSYTVAIEPITVAINIYTPDPPYIVEELYSGSMESFDPVKDATTSSQEVSVVQGSATENINILLNENGRLKSGQTVQGKMGSLYSDLDYFVSVFPGVKAVEFILESDDAKVNLDLFARCDNEFALTASLTSPVIFDFNEQVLQQSEFSGTNLEGRESIRLDKDSDPALQVCTYHLLVMNNGLSSSNGIGFKLTVNIDMDRPSLLVKESVIPENSLDQNNRVVLKSDFYATGDIFRLQTLRIHEEGDENFSMVSGASLYLDENNDGVVSNEDSLLATHSSIDLVNRTVSFANFDILIQPEHITALLVVYSINATQAHIPLCLLLGMIGMFIFSLFSDRARKGSETAGVCILLLLAWSGVRCSEKHYSGYHPIIKNEKSLGVSGMTFQDDIYVRVGDNYSSVKDYFR